MQDETPDLFFKWDAAFGGSVYDSPIGDVFVAWECAAAVSELKHGLNRRRKLARATAGR